MTGRKYPLQKWPGPGPKPKVWDDDSAFSHAMRQKYIDRREARKRAVREELRRRRDPWYAAETVEVTIPEGRIFDCGTIPHIAVALADLDCRIRLKNEKGWLELAGGRAIRGADFLSSSRPIRGGETLLVQAKGADAQKALEVVEKVVAEDRRERTERHPQIRGWWERQRISTTPMEGMRGLVSLKRMMGLGGLR